MFELFDQFLQFVQACKSVVRNHVHSGLQCKKVLRSGSAFLIYFENMQFSRIASPVMVQQVQSGGRDSKPEGSQLGAGKPPRKAHRDPLTTSRKERNEKTPTRKSKQ